jgi:hypothetical protein
MNNTFVPVFTYAYDELLKKQKDLALPLRTELNFTEIEACFATCFKKQSSTLRIPRSVLEQSSIFLYELLRRPVAKSKNSQVALSAFLLFVYTRGYWVEMSAYELHNLVRWIKLSDKRVRILTIKSITHILKPVFVRYS